MGPLYLMFLNCIPCYLLVQKKKTHEKIMNYSPILVLGTKPDLPLLCGVQWMEKCVVTLILWVKVYSSCLY